MSLHNLPERIVRELAQRLTGPVPVLAFTEPVVELYLGDLSPIRRGAAVSRGIGIGIGIKLGAFLPEGDGGRCFPAAVQGAADNRRERHLRQPAAERCSLRLPAIVKGDAGHPAGKRLTG